MPVKSIAQMKAMGAAASGRSTLGIPASVGRDFIASTPKGAAAHLPQKVGKAMPAHHHALMKASATALYHAGHIDEETHDNIHSDADASLKHLKKMKMKKMKAKMATKLKAHAPTFGRLGPVQDVGPGGGVDMGDHYRTARRGVY